MAVFFPLNSRKANHRKVKPTQQLITFHIYPERFALPIRAVHKVIQKGKIYGAPHGGTVGLTLYQEKELLVMDVEGRIFKGRPNQNLALNPSYTEIENTDPENTDPENSLEEINSPANINKSFPVSVSAKPEEDRDDSERGYLLIVQNKTGNIIGLPIEEPPALLRVNEDNFRPLTSNYLNQGNIQCVSALIVTSPEDPPIFLLNPDLLFQTQYSLPSCS
ncbi:MAG TPA: chemotaxis protein CheW [Cyanobacteria bacterium UBA11367]|nr:chemotaxis protein CheW [Cyanobacteria bacterium UBA11367]HBE58777.1 chemotaxis protein CheW [Cyanobacteria bacterium UBA11366]HBS69225.1 chemotaxis protein CheW [Cyanobacteria bacterium UBA11153]HCA94910.1 chemotaxis protein CheW [Cyanobacteria bacterium UBA9226]